MAGGDEVVRKLRTGGALTWEDIGQAADLLEQRDRELAEARLTIARCSGYKDSVEHHKARAEAAEARLAEAVEGLKRIARAPTIPHHCECLSGTDPHCAWASATVEPARALSARLQPSTRSEEGQS